MKVILELNHCAYFVQQGTSSNTTDSNTTGDGNKRADDSGTLNFKMGEAIQNTVNLIQLKIRVLNSY
jgi:hypothetical protein